MVMVVDGLVTLADKFVYKSVNGYYPWHLNPVRLKLLTGF